MRHFFVTNAILFCLTSLMVNAQDWPKSFTNRYAYWLTENYDMGYLIIGPIDNFKYGFIVKTDINGSLLWEKRIGNGLYTCIAGSIEPTVDGGFVVSGQTNKYESLGDPFIMKFSSCGEVVWCTVIHLPNTDDFAISVKPTPTNEFVLLTIYSDPSPWHHTQLYKFDSTGELIWRQDYPVQGNAFEDEPRNLRVDSSTYLISGMCYYPDPGVPGGYERPYYICTDTAGNVNWRLVFGAENGFHGTSFYSPVHSNSGFNYDVVVHSNFCDTPAMIKFSDSGEELFYEDMLPGSCPGGSNNPVWLNDSAMAIKVIGIINGNEIMKWIIIDTMGIEKNAINYNDPWMRYTYQSILTKDQKLACRSSNGSSTAYFYKLNTNLELDSLYTMPRTYDSLCPYPIVSDTVDPDCGLIVSILDPEIEPEAYLLKIYPNPASGKLTIEVPEFFEKRTGPADFQVSTIYHQWGSATLEAWDLFGKKLMEKAIEQGSTPVELDVSHWPAGMVVFRLVYRGETVATEKVVVR